MKKMTNLLKSLAVAVVLMVTAQATNAQQKIGHVNSQELLQSTKEFKAAEEQLKALGETKQKELQSMFAEFQKKQAEATEKYNNKSIANAQVIDAELEKLAEELRSMEQRMQENQNKAREELGQKETDLLTPIHQKVLAAINSVAKEKGYAYVLDIASGSVIFFEAGDDLTAAVKTKLGV